MNTTSWDLFGSGHFLTAAAMHWYWETYLHGETTTSLASRRLESTPPTYLVTSELDPSSDEGLALVRALREQGTDVTDVRLEGVPHGCLTLPGAFPSQIGHIDRIGAWINSAIDQLPETPPERNTL